MAKRNTSGLVPNQNTILTITDINGNVAMEITDEETLLVDANGSITSYSRTSSIQLVDGLMWTRDMMFKAKNPVYLAVCENCRHPGISLWRRRRPNHGLVAMHRAKLCVSCGQLCCPSHRKQGKDQRWRCLSCHKRYTVGRLLLPVFYERKED